MKIAVLIPCYNEALTIGKVVTDFKEVLPEADIYVYDNNCTDNTAEIAAKAGAIVREEPRKGKGNVVRSMFRDIEADYYLMVDGDDTYPASFAWDLLNPLIAGEANMTIGDRLSNGSYFEENKRKFHDFGNKIVKGTINTLYRANITDVMTGYRGFDRLFVEGFPVMSPEFEIETELTLHALDKRFKLKEVNIDYRDRPEGSESKLNTLTDGFKVISVIFRLFKDYKPLLFFSLFALLFFVLGLFSGIPVVLEFSKTHFITKIPSAILAVGLMIFAGLSLVCGLILDTIANNALKQYEMDLFQIDRRIKREQRRK